jgi:thiosulfate/3-mercaptopyruvate sulfurtransferase
MRTPFPTDTHPLVSTAWLAAQAGMEDLFVVDGSYATNPDAPDVAEAFLRGHIPSASLFDIRDISDQNHPAPLMLPSASDFATRVGEMGIGNHHRVVVYDSGDMLNAGRVWWMFRTFGHRAVAVLDGGLPKWRAEEREIESGATQLPPMTFHAAYDPVQLRTLDDMRSLVSDSAEQVLDVREYGRFTGAVPEKRLGLRSGHMPGAQHLSYLRFKTADNTLPEPATLRALFAEAGIDHTRPVVTTCGGGVAAGLVALGLERIGHTDWALYDGSWAEWAAEKDTPVETGDT